MTQISKASLSNLHRRTEAILDSLAKDQPAAVAELRLLLGVIRQREQSTGVEFAGIRAPRKAIEYCLAERGKPMTKQQILDRLIEGGFVRNVDTEKWLINDAINFGVRKGYFIAVNDEPKWNALIAINLDVGR